MADGTVIGAGWTDDFVAAVVECLRAGAESRSTEAAASAPGPTDTAPTQSAPTAPTDTAPTEDALPEMPASAVVDTAPPAAPGSPDVRFDEVGTSDRHIDPSTTFADALPADPRPVEPAPAVADPDGGVFSAQPVVRNRSRRAESNGSSAGALPAESDAITPPVVTPPADAAPVDVAPAADASDRIDVRCGQRRSDASGRRAVGPFW